MKKNLCIALVCLTICLGAALAAEAPIPAPNEPGAGYENLGSTDIYAAPEEGAEYAGHLATGELVTVLENQGDWVKVQATRPSGVVATGWLLRSGIGRLKSDMPYFGKAYVNNPNPEDRLNLRQGPGTRQESLGLYYNGTVALCWSDPEDGEWVLVTIGQVAGYMQRKFLRLETEGDAVAPATPLMAVNNPDAGKGLNLREKPDLASEALGLYPNGQRVVVLGISGEWAHVQIAGPGDVPTTETGYMLRGFLTKAEADAPNAGLEAVTLAPTATLQPADASPALKAEGKGAEGFRHLERGYTVVCAVSELLDGRYYAHCIAAYDNGFEAADGIVAFRLYLNGESVATLERQAEGDQDPAAPPTAFRCTFAFEGDLASAHLVPVLAAAGEYPAETVSLTLR